MEETAARVCYGAGLDKQGRPLIVLSLPSLPDPHACDHDELLDIILRDLVEHINVQDYSLIVFCGGGSKESKPSWPWVIQAYSRLGKDFKKQVKAVWLVHSTWWIRVLFDLVNHLVSPKFAKKVHHVPNLKDLAALVPIEQVRISEKVVNHDRRLQGELDSNDPNTDMSQQCTNPKFIFGKSLRSSLKIESNTQCRLPKVMVDLFHLVKAERSTPGIFRVSPLSSKLKSARLSIDQGMPISDIDPNVHLAAALLKLWLRTLPAPLFSQKTYPLIRTLPYSLHDVDMDLNATKIADMLSSILPEEELFVFRELCLLLHAVWNARRFNKMDADALVTCVGQSLVRCMEDPVTDSIMLKPRGGLYELLVDCIQNPGCFTRMPSSESSKKIAPPLPNRRGTSRSNSSCHDVNEEVLVVKDRDRDMPPPAIPTRRERKISPTAAVLSERQLQDVPQKEIQVAPPEDQSLLDSNAFKAELTATLSRNPSNIEVDKAKGNKTNTGISGKENIPIFTQARVSGSPSKSPKDPKAPQQYTPLRRAASGPVTSAPKNPHAFLPLATDSNNSAPLFSISGNLKRASTQSTFSSSDYLRNRKIGKVGLEAGGVSNLKALFEQKAIVASSMNTLSVSTVNTKNGGGRSASAGARLEL